MKAQDIVDVLLEVDQGQADPEMDKFLRDAGVTVEMDDFDVTHRSGSFAGYSTGNSNYYVSYKPLHYRGKPVYLGSVSATHDYNRTGHSGHVNFYASPPVRMWTYNPVSKMGPIYGKRGGKPRTNLGYGNVHMNKPPEGTSGHFTSLFDACKYLLSLLKTQNKHLKVHEALDRDILKDMQDIAINPLLVPKKTKVEFLRAEGDSYFFVVSLLRSRFSYRHYLGTLRRDASGQWFVDQVPDIVLRKHIQPFSEPDKAFATDVAAEKALIKHIIDQFPDLITPRW